MIWSCPSPVLLALSSSLVFARVQSSISTYQIFFLTDYLYYIRSPFLCVIRLYDVPSPFRFNFVLLPPTFFVLRKSLLYFDQCLYYPLFKLVTDLFELMLSELNHLY